jgi:16S rRNA (guanine527-N7)-methyltransferase
LTAPQIAAILESLRGDPRAPISASSRADARRVHIDDSLAGLEVDELAGAGRIGDVGSGAGLPGLVLAASLPDARVDLIESVGRKCEFIRAAIERAGLDNAEVVPERAERWAAGAGAGAYDAVTARAIGRLATVAELASPLLQPGGVLVAWEGRRDREQEAELDRALPNLAMEVVEIRPVTPYEGSRDRHIHLLRKNGPTPKELPRRDGLAAKRPFGSE